MSSPSHSSWAPKASASESKSIVNAWAAVPDTGMPQVRPASRSEVELKPAIQAARAAATAEAS